MRSPLPLLAPLVLLTACGPREPGPHPGEQLVWGITSWELQVGECSDREDVKTAFADAYAPIPTDGTRLLPLRVNAEGTQAEMLTGCTSRSAGSCQPSGFFFTVSGHELSNGSNGQTPLGNTGCDLAVATSWVVTDQGQTMESTLTDTYTLVGPPETCAQANQNIRGTSPNGKGLEGCTVVQHLGGTLLN